MHCMEPFGLVFGPEQSRCALPNAPQPPLLPFYLCIRAPVQPEDPPGGEKGHTVPAERQLDCFDMVAEMDINLQSHRFYFHQIYCDSTSYLNDYKTRTKCDKLLRNGTSPLYSSVENYTACNQLGRGARRRSWLGLVLLSGGFRLVQVLSLLLYAAQGKYLAQGYYLVLQQEMTFGPGSFRYKAVALTTLRIADLEDLPYVHVMEHWELEKLLNCVIMRLQVTVETVPRDVSIPLLSVCSEQSICQARASVMIYDDTSKKWVPIKPGQQGFSRINIYHNTASNSFRVVGVKLQDQQVVINYSIVKGLKYNQATPTFHQWRDARQVYGLNFASKEEATTFSNAMLFALNMLSSQDGGPAVQRQAQNGPTTDDADAQRR
ncbi:hypothetical protein Z043_107901 [Scleropages formosus]|uniref:Ena/VASP-like protein n=1 Tax=Scleropages formosus TaxID=113540 RepID=A0A0P7YXZ0_SCLFO|nr:hypothetical protein Z043_107901 [Scleropages formosus]